MTLWNALHPASTNLDGGHHVPWQQKHRMTMSESVQKKNSKYIRKSALQIDPEAKKGERERFIKIYDGFKVNGKWVVWGLVVQSIYSIIVETSFLAEGSTDVTSAGVPKGWLTRDGSPDRWKGKESWKRMWRKKNTSLVSKINMLHI